MYNDPANELLVYTYKVHTIHIAFKIPNHACYMKSFYLSRSLGQTT